MNAPSVTSKSPHNRTSSNLEDLLGRKTALQEALKTALAEKRRIESLNPNNSSISFSNAGVPVTSNIGNSEPQLEEHDVVLTSSTTQPASVPNNSSSNQGHVTRLSQKHLVLRQSIFSTIRAGSVVALQRNLLSGAYDANEVDYHRATPLHIAAHEGREDMVMVLLSFGADVFALDKKGRTASDLAAAGRHSGLSLLLQSAMERRREKQTQPITAPSNTNTGKKPTSSPLKGSSQTLSSPRQEDGASPKMKREPSGKGESPAAPQSADGRQQKEKAKPISSRHTTIYDDQSLIICLVGLPGRGKSFISKRISRYLNWKGVACRVFNAGDYRRRLLGVEGTAQSNFYDPNNEAAKQAREQMAQFAMEDLADFIESTSLAVGILDATNTTVERRHHLLEYFLLERFGGGRNGENNAFFIDKNGNRVNNGYYIPGAYKKKTGDSDETGGATANDDASTFSTKQQQQRPRRIPKVIFIESVCQNEDIITENILRAKCTNDDFKSVKDPIDVIREFRDRIVQYEKVYQTCSPKELLPPCVYSSHVPTQPLGVQKVPDPISKSISYIKIVDVKESIVLHRVRGGLPSRVAFFLMNLHPISFPVFISLPGETKGNIAGRFGGDQTLTSAGKEYAKKLRYFIRQRIGGGGDSVLVKQKHFPGCPEYRDNTGKEPASNHKKKKPRVTYVGGKPYVVVKGKAFPADAPESLQAMKEAEETNDDDSSNDGETTTTDTSVPQLSILSSTNPCVEATLKLALHPTGSSIGNPVHCLQDDSPPPTSAAACRTHSHRAVVGGCKPIPTPTNYDSATTSGQSVRFELNEKGSEGSTTPHSCKHSSAGKEQRRHQGLPCFTTSSGKGDDGHIVDSPALSGSEGFESSSRRDHLSSTFNGEALSPLAASMASSRYIYGTGQPLPPCSLSGVGSPVGNTITAAGHYQPRTEGKLCPCCYRHKRIKALDDLRYGRMANCTESEAKEKYPKTASKLFASKGVYKWEAVVQDPVDGTLMPLAAANNNSEASLMPQDDQQQQGELPSTTRGVFNLMDPVYSHCPSPHLGVSPSIPPNMSSTLLLPPAAVGGCPATDSSGVVELPQAVHSSSSSRPANDTLVKRLLKRKAGKHGKSRSWPAGKVAEGEDEPVVGGGNVNKGRKGSMDVGEEKDGYASEDEDDPHREEKKKKHYHHHQRESHHHHHHSTTSNRAALSPSLSPFSLLKDEQQVFKSRGREEGVTTPLSNTGSHSFGRRLAAEEDDGLFESTGQENTDGGSSSAVGSPSVGGLQAVKKRHHHRSGGLKKADSHSHTRKGTDNTLHRSHIDGGRQRSHSCPDMTSIRKKLDGGRDIAVSDDAPPNALSDGADKRLHRHSTKAASAVPLSMDDAGFSSSVGTHPQQLYTLPEAMALSPPTTTAQTTVAKKCIKMPQLSYPISFPKGESQRQCNVRLEPAILEILRADGPVLVVAPLAPAQGLLAFLTDVLPEDSPGLDIPKHCVMEVGVKGQVIVHRL